MSEKYKVKKDIKEYAKESVALGCFSSIELCRGFLSSYFLPTTAFRKAIDGGKHSNMAYATGVLVGSGASLYTLFEGLSFDPNPVSKYLSFGLIGLYAVSAAFETSLLYSKKSNSENDIVIVDCDDDNSGLEKKLK